MEGGLSAGVMGHEASDTKGQQHSGEGAAPRPQVKSSQPALPAVRGQPALVGVKRCSRCQELLALEVVSFMGSISVIQSMLLPRAASDM